MTGGQTNLKLAPSVQNSLNPKINKVGGTKSLLRIKATDKENKLHEEYLSSILNNEN